VNGTLPHDQRAPQRVRKAYAVRTQSYGFMKGARLTSESSSAGEKFMSAASSKWVREDTVVAKSDTLSRRTPLVSPTNARRRRITAICERNIWTPNRKLKCDILPIAAIMSASKQLPCLQSTQKHPALESRCARNSTTCQSIYVPSLFVQMSQRAAPLPSQRQCVSPSFSELAYT
jgi:hypothetical protein